MYVVFYFVCVVSFRLILSCSVFLFFCFVLFLSCAIGCCFILYRIVFPCFVFVLVCFVKLWSVVFCFDLFDLLRFVLCCLSCVVFVGCCFVCLFDLVLLCCVLSCCGSSLFCFRVSSCEFV